MKSEKPLSLSIVIPVYNEEHHLRDCLNAIAHQSVKPDQVIVVDNNSTDDSVKIAHSYAFVEVVHENQHGVSYARNRGFDMVKAGIIARIDGDTIVPAHWVAHIKSFYSQSKYADVARTGGGYFYNIRLPNFAGWAQGQIAFRFNRLLLGHYIVWGSNMALPVTLWQSVRTSVCVRQDIHEDLDLAIHLHEAGIATAYQAGIKVGVMMRRIRSNHDDLWYNMMLWPKTLKVHHKKTWVFGWLGAISLYGLSPLLVLAEKIARLSGRPPLAED